MSKPLLLLLCSYSQGTGPSLGRFLSSFKSIMVGFASRLLEPKNDVGLKVMEGLCDSMQFNLLTA